MIHLTIVICTRNREQHLEDCVNSISKQKIRFDKSIEILIIDDGDLQDGYINNLKSNLGTFEFNYHKKKNKGLYLSRLTSAKLAKGDILLFLDDDVVLEPSYLNELFYTYECNNSIIGAGGVDILMQKLSFLYSIYTRLFLLRSWKTGSLSVTGFNSSINKWKYQKEKIDTEFLNGCNMSFKRRALKSLPTVDFFQHYSLGEDIFISLLASKDGGLIVNPKMRVKHFHAPTSRDKIKHVARMKILNHFKLLPYTKGSNIKYYIIFWTFFGMMLASLLKCNHKELSGYFSAIKSITSN